MDKNTLVRIDRRAGGRVDLTLDRPEKMNALSAEMVEALIDALDQAHTAGAQLIVLRGSGKNFSAGFDFGGLETQSEGDLLWRFVRIETLLQRLASSPCVTVAFAHGRNFGAGVDLFAACRIRVATPDANFRLPGLKFGLVLGSRRFAHIVGTQAARSILQQARPFDAAHALSIGFVERLAPREQWPALEDEAATIASQLTGSSRAQLYDALDPRCDDQDLARLVRSAATPGLKLRIAQYLAAPG